MHAPALTHIDNPGPLALGGKWRTAFIALIAAGVLALVGGIATNAARAWHNYLVAYFMFVGFGVFGLFFTALNHAVNAKWMLVTRRVSEGLTAFLPVAVILFAGLVVGSKDIYDWAARTPEGDPLKYKWLSMPWFALRGVVFLLIWAFFARKLTSLSLQQDATGDVLLSRKMRTWSIVFLPIFAGTFSLASFDWIMSLDHKWWSTMFGVYCFAGVFQSGLALLTIVFILLKRQGALAKVATQSHLKDLGNFVFAFTIFMTYIGFSQYMLIWYANLPEETFYFLNRQQGGWEYLFIALPVFKFVIPFFGLISQALKKNEKWLFTVCVVAIIGQYLDLYWMVMPALRRTFVPFGWVEIGSLLLFLGIFGLVISRFFARHSVLAARDPRILESANWRYWE